MKCSTGRFREAVLCHLILRRLAFSYTVPAMKVLSNNEGLRLGPLFSGKYPITTRVTNLKGLQVVYHTQSSPFLLEAGTQQMQLDEVMESSSNIFEVLVFCILTQWF